MKSHSLIVSRLCNMGVTSLLIAIMTVPLCAGPLMVSADFKSAEEGKRPPGFRLVNGSDAEVVVSKGEVRFTKSSKQLLAVSTDSALEALSDYTVTTRLRFGGGNELWGGVVARVKNDNSFYHARIYSFKEGRAELQLYRVGGPGTLLLGKAEFDLRVGVAMTLTLSVKGTTQDAVLTDLSGNKIASAQGNDPVYTEGPAGMRAYPRSSVVVYETFTVSKE